MGFPFAEATWDVVDGAMYMGAGSISTLVFTVISAALCVYALWRGHRKEHELYDKLK